MAAVEPTSQAELPAGNKLRDVGEPFKHPIPGDGDHWSGLLEPLMEKDRIQCAAWKEEAHNLVVFVGTPVSSIDVLSAFVIQTIQNLQEDPHDQIILLLSQISRNMGASNTTLFIPSEAPATFTPSPSSVRVNVLWLVSLVLSLTTVLIAIVALQWLREHQNYPTSFTPKDKFALFHMRQEGLKKWHIPKIISSIPVLLLLALILFWIGLIDFVSEFVPGVSIPVIFVTCTPLLFILLTTTLPSVQMFYSSIASASDPSGNPPSQCPYKSTQSWLLHRIAMISSPFFILHMIPMVVVCWFGDIVRRPKQTILGYGTHHPGLFFFFKSRWYKTPCAELYDFWKTSSWVSFDNQWLKFRASYFAASDTLGYSYWGDFYHAPRSAYDCTQGILDIQLQISRASDEMKDEETLFQLYHGIEDTVNQVVDDADSYVTCIQSLIQSQTNHSAKPQITLSDLFEGSFASPQKELIREETLYLFLHRFPHHSSTIVRYHTYELHARLMSYPLQVDHFRRLSHRIIHAKLPDYLRQPRWEQSQANPFLGFPITLRGQYAQSLHLLFNILATKQLPETVLQGTFFLDILLCLTRTSSFQLEDDAVQTTDRLTDFLKGSFNTQSHDIYSEILFGTAALYAKAMTKSSSPHTYSSHLDAQEESLLALMDALRKYARNRDRNVTRTISVRLDIPDLPPVGQTNGTWWSFMQR